MTNARQNIRTFKDYCDGNNESLRITAEGIVKDYSKKSKKVIVEILPERFTKTMRYIFPNAGKDVQIGGMPPLDSKVLVIFQRPFAPRPYDHAIAIGGIFDEETNTYPEEHEEGKSDVDYYTIKPPKGGKTEYFKDNVIETVDKDKRKIIHGNETQTISGNKHITCDEIKLGHPDSTKKLVNEDLLTKYNNLLNDVTSFMNQLQGMTILGDMGIPLPLAARSAGTYATISAPIITAINSRNSADKTTNLTAT